MLDHETADHDDGSGGQAASGGSCVVQSGDTLTGIAAEIGICVDDSDYVEAGRKLSC